MESEGEGNGVRELYANYFHIGSNSAEFLLDFGRHFENSDQKIYQRIIMTPMHAKVLSQLLAESILHYETRFGPIPGDVHE